MSPMSVSFPGSKIQADHVTDLLHRQSGVSHH